MERKLKLTQNKIKEVEKFEKVWGRELNTQMTKGRRN